MQTTGRANIDYHLRELAIARDPSSPLHAMPNFRDSDRAILDIGCGIGQTLVASDAGCGRQLIGLDIDPECLRYGRREFQQVDFVIGSAEQLPFRDGAFDLVVSRVALPYAHLGQALAELARVVDDDGRVWLTMHSFAKTWAHLQASLRIFALRDVIFRGYVIVNGLLLHCTGQEFRFPLSARHESFQTISGMHRSLHQAGFTDIHVEQGQHFICTARKKPRERTSLEATHRVVT